MFLQLSGDVVPTGIEISYWGCLYEEKSCSFDLPFSFPRHHGIN